MQRTWRQSTAKRTISGGSFTQGVIDFDFSVGSQTVFIPSKTYFRIGVKLTNTDGEAPELSDQLAFANFCPGNMFDNSFFYAGSQNVSSCINYGPQAHALAYRLKKSGAWLNSIGKDAYGICASYKYRHEMSASNGKPEDATSAVPSLDSGDASIRYFIYQPPLGIMEHSSPMGAGAYRFQFNPAANFKKACVESDTDIDNYSFDVQSMELCVCEEKMDVLSTGVDRIYLTEHRVQAKKLRDSANLDFTLPVSTKAISIFVQSGLAGVDSTQPPSKFTTADGVHKKSRNLQLTFANTTKPPTNWSSETGDHTMKLQQRYFDTQVETGQAFSLGGCESLSDWLMNGPVYHYTFERDGGDRSTQLQMTTNFEEPAGGFAANDNIFVVAHFTRTVDIEVESGYITNVTSQDM